MSSRFPDGNDRFPFCPRCGARFGRAVRAGRERLLCPSCGFVFYQNPNAGVAAIVIEDGAVLLTKRGGSVRAGLWDLPGGFVEYDEDIRDALVREMREETGLTIEVGRVFDVRSNFFHDTQRHSVGVWFLARRVSGVLGAADDVVDARFFRWTRCRRTRRSRSRQTVRCSPRCALARHHPRTSTQRPRRVTTDP